jgi:hypothetical protein
MNQLQLSTTTPNGQHLNMLVLEAVQQVLEHAK